MVVWGSALGKANEVPEAIRKGMEAAKRMMFNIPLADGTIPHEVLGRFGASSVVLKPASPVRESLPEVPCGRSWKRLEFTTSFTKCIWDRETLIMWSKPS